MKPSERIDQLFVKHRQEDKIYGVNAQYWQALLDYLDEEYEKSKKDENIT